MSTDVVETTKKLVLPILAEKGLELVRVEFNKLNKNWYLRVFIDKPGGVNIDDCQAVSEILSAKLDEVDPIEQAYVLEVSSPGAERPLENEEDVKKAVGKHVHITTREAMHGQHVFEGRLLAFEDQQLTIELKEKGKKKTVEIPYALVAKARLAVVL